MFLGAACMLLVLQYADADRSKERHARFMAVADEQMALYKVSPTDYDRILQLTKKSLAILKEKESDPWVIRNLIPMSSLLIVLAVGIGWVQRLDSHKKNDA
jgi:hypothetical protein